MKTNLLAPPAPGSPVLSLFLERFGLDRGAAPRELLGRAASAFARLPYENLTKILKHDREEAPERARRAPLEVITEHIASGAGGTCFSLTAALLHIVRGLGLEAKPLLADRRYGQNTHCALAVWIDGAPHLIDPGYLIVQPVLLGGKTEARLKTPFNEIVLVPRDDGAKLDLFTEQAGSRTYRLTIKVEPADPGEFLRAWDASFEWDMMRYPLLTRVKGGGQVYLQGNRLQVRTASDLTRIEVDPEALPTVIASQFGVDPSITARALAVLRRKGEKHASAPAR